MLSNLLDIVKDVTHDYIAADDRIEANDKDVVASIVINTINSGVEKNVSTVLRHLLTGDVAFFKDKLSDDIHEALFLKTKLDFDKVSLLSQGVVSEIVDTIYGSPSKEEIMMDIFFEVEASKIKRVFDKVKGLFLLSFDKTEAS